MAPSDILSTLTEDEKVVAEVIIPIMKAWGTERTSEWFYLYHIDWQKAFNLLAAEMTPQQRGDEMDKQNKQLAELNNDNYRFVELQRRKMFGLLVKMVLAAT